MAEHLFDGGPAFPVSTHEDIASEYGHQDGNSTWQYGGLTRRDYFAAKAMTQVMSNFPCEIWNQGVETLHGTEYLDLTAKAAYRMADAMLRARAQQ